MESQDIRHKIKKKLAAAGILLAAIILINCLFAFSDGVQVVYFHKVYPFLSAIPRTIFGWIPLSCGDLLYLLLALVIFFFLVTLVKELIRFRRNKWLIGWQLLNACMVVLGLYILFMILWGFNYRSHRLREAFGVSLIHQYSVPELEQLCIRFSVQANREQEMLTGDVKDSTTLQFLSPVLFREVEANYRRMSATYPDLAYRHFSVKPSIYSYLMNYIGVEGYYNPFTGEAQVNTTVPAFLLPFVSCHEVAHQLGFAPEYAANFVGYLVASSSPDPRFRYSASFEMLLYGLGELRFRDSAAARSVWNKLNPGVQKDYRALRNFYRDFHNPVDPFMAQLYDRYLKANRQERGIHSYNEVVGLLVDYYRKQNK